MACGAAWYQWMGISRAIGEPIKLCYQVPKSETSGHSSGLRTVDSNRCLCTVGIAEKEW